MGKQDNLNGDNLQEFEEENLENEGCAISFVSLVVFVVLVIVALSSMFFMASR